MESVDWNKALEVFLVTFIAAFVGVWAAYKMEREQRNKVEELNRLKDFCNAQMQLRLQHTLLKALKDYLAIYEGDNERHKKLAPTAIPKNISYLCLEHMKFLLLKNNVLAYNIITLQQSIHMTLSNYEARNIIHFKWQANPVNGSSNEENARLRLCEKQLKERTDINYSEIFSIIEQLEYFMSELSSYAKTEFKNVEEVDMYTENFHVEAAKTS